MGGGTEVFADLGRHCQLPDCRQLDFLPFNCNACHKVFCLDHRTYEAHDCPNSDINSRKVLVCDICSTAVETTGHVGEAAKKLLEKHERSGDCDPKKKKKPTCPVRRCKEILTFSNASTCKHCGMKVCLNHRFHADHTGEQVRSAPSSSNAAANKFLAAMAARSGNDCGSKIPKPSPSPNIKAC